MRPLKLIPDAGAYAPVQMRRKKISFSPVGGGIFITWANKGFFLLKDISYCADKSFTGYEVTNI